MSGPPPKIKSFDDYAERLLIQPGTQADIDTIENLPSSERNLIVFVVAQWCSHCISCIEKINELFAKLVKAEHQAIKAGKKIQQPTVLVFDADQYTHQINAMIADPEHHVSGFPGIVLFKADQVQLHRKERDVDTILVAWQKL